ncbi:MAG TPA: bifunctional acetate--CoA ligase family protein/GNAT family N-acetyltransferase [Planctomycetota bacterium]|nr:bifunctional acetate--CoA ligase family protein/GNAT family N-acetyltransferase [Planctomycetota bacterium]
MTPHYLDRLFSPRSVAVFGASDDASSAGGRVFANILEGGFEGALYPINTSRREVCGRTSFASLAEVDRAVDVAVIATPAATVPSVLVDCGEHGVPCAVVLSAGFEEGGSGGEEREADLLREARRFGIRLLGPNCLGFLRPDAKLNATFGRGGARPGSLALVSQSGALCTAILDWALDRRVGFSAVVSIGDAADVDFGDVLDYLALDPATKGILLYVEGVRHPRRFMSGLRVAARLKPTVVVKAGRHAEGSKAARSHTGAIVGGDDAFDAALRRAGAVRAFTVEQLFAAAELLATHTRVRGNRLAIVTNAGGPGVLAADRAAELPVRLAELSAATTASLDAQLPAFWSHGNPVDILGDATPDRYRGAVAACLADPQVDGVVAILTPQAMTDPTSAAEAVLAAAGAGEKPLLACWMGGAHVAEARARFARSGVPSFEGPEAAVEAFGYLASYRENQRLLLQTPGPRSRSVEPDVEGARLLVENALDEGRTTLSVTESKALLTAFRIPVATAVRAASPAEALVAAESLGFPVAMKIDSPDVTHKSDVGGVRLDIRTAADVRRAYAEMAEETRAHVPDARIPGVTIERMVKRRHGRELLVGVARDPVFGPVIGFGAGGTAVEILRDHAVALPPLNGFIAADLIARTRAGELLGPFRGQPAADGEAVVDVLLRVSELVCELPHVRELDINPLVADENGVVALDARVVVEFPGAPRGPYGHMAIHPYPADLLTRWQLPDGTDVTIRPIRPEDAELEQAFVRKLSPESRYFRFMRTLAELTPEMLVRFTQIDYDREMAFVACVVRDGQETELGVARYVANPDRRTCEFAVVIGDEWQGKGIASRLMTELMRVARERGLSAMQGEVLASNTRMFHLMKNLGFVVGRGDDPSVHVVTKEL